MAKNKNRSKQHPSFQSKDEKPEISEQTERIFKKILKTMSWIVGVCIVLIIILPMFESETLDIITKFLFYIGAINLIAFTIIEFITDAVKLKIQSLIEQSS